MFPDTKLDLSKHKIPLVVFDLDGILSFTGQTIVDSLNQHFGTNYTFEEVHNYSLDKVFPLEQAQWCWEQMKESQWYENIQPNHHAINALNIIRLRGYETIIVTDRPPITTTGTLNWLKQHKIEADEVIVGGLGAKLRFSTNHGVHQPLVVIDDNPEMAKALPRPGIMLFSPKIAWTKNHVKTGPGVCLFEEWQEVINYFPVLPVNSKKQSQSTLGTVSSIAV